ncbi:NUDIX hydrolase [Falsibacillus albus]|nr:NUDIX domain-containing protein [Falsibacillus albus]
MEETLNIFNENYQRIGEASRDEVHDKGYWHETFQCWCYSCFEGTPYIYFQMRSPEKKDYPNQLDITAAGHILANETLEDGVRELEEELGIESVDPDELEYAGMIKNEIITTSITDREFCHVYLYQLVEGFQFDIQEEELSGIFHTPLEEFIKLIEGDAKSIKADGFFQKDMCRVEKTLEVTKEDFVPHDHAYYKALGPVFRGITDPKPK